MHNDERGRLKKLHQAMLRRMIKCILKEIRNSFYHSRDSKLKKTLENFYRNPERDLLIIRKIARYITMKKSKTNGFLQEVSL